MKMIRENTEGLIISNNKLHDKIYNGCYIINRFIYGFIITMVINKKRPDMVISLIAAMASNRVIGNRGYTPWRIPGDLRRFRNITIGHTLIMGRKTYESIGHSLPRRTNIILTRQTDYNAPGCIIARDLRSAIEICPKDENEVFICGGGQLYKEALPIADRIYLSTVHREIPGDVYFPEFSLTEFKKKKSEYVEDIIPYTFSLYERIDCQGLHTTHNRKSYNNRSDRSVL